GTRHTPAARREARTRAVSPVNPRPASRTHRAPAPPAGVRLGERATEAHPLGRPNPAWRFGTPQPARTRNAFRSHTRAARRTPPRADPPTRNACVAQSARG